ncbi:hypothetical protein Rhal01_03565 [Rubritalea halochordaticola]|uniref:Zinc ribbon domain-containing protein n=1 Tax=Rubritalea halochordaticola TaxID=714537 RepID=A0ABP9V3Y1_9BACT
MSEGQTFYLLITLFYLSSCIKSAAPGGIAIKKNLLKGWSIRQPMATLAGVGKSLYLAPLSPWPGAILLSSSCAKQSAKITRASAWRLLRLTHRATTHLRFISLLIFALFFAVIPYIYYLDGDSIRTRLVIGYAFFLILYASLCFFCIHRRFVPKRKAERIKHLLLNIISPWSAMRCSDDILMQGKLQAIHPLTMASLCKDSERTTYLGQALRDSIYRKEPQFTLEEVKSTLAASGIKQSDLTKPPLLESDDSSQYCPCCLTTFSAGTAYCEECDHVPLKSFRDPEQQAS